MPLALLGRPLLINSNSAKLTWTATGDDSRSGTASYYDIRYSAEPVGIDTAMWWQNAVRLESPPAPEPAGRISSWVVSNLSIDKHYYFAIKVADEVFNWSGISKIAELCPLNCADVNGDGTFDYRDPMYLLDYLYGSGSLVLTGAGDVDRSGELNVADAIFMINYRINSGPPPDCGD